MKNKIIFFCFLFIFAAASLFADTITLKSGKEFEAKVLEKTSDSLRVDFYGVEVAYSLDEVEAINGEKVTPAAKKDTVVTVVDEKGPVISESVPLASPNPPVQEPDFKFETSQAAFTSSRGQVIPPAMAGFNPKQGFNPKTQRAAAGMAAGAVFVFLLIGLIFYVYSAVCLQTIAKKTNQEPAWLAWVPIGNLFLMCKIAEISYAYLLVLLIAFIPLLNMIASLAFMGLTGYIWYKIALVRNKPGWIGALAFLPLVNFIVIGYLAFSD